MTPHLLCHAFATHTLIEVVGKGLEVPKDGWTPAAFARQGTLLLRVMHRLAQLTQRKALPHVAATAKRIMREQMRKVVERAMGRAPKKAPTFLEIIMPQHEALWMQALDEVFRETGIEATMELMPPIQSVMGRAYSTTNMLLAQDGDLTGRQRLAREARDIALRITAINDTTRKQFERVIRNAIDEGATVTETARRLTDDFPAMAGSRIGTIARTELNNAYTKGAVTSYQESSTVTHVSVIGCESRELDRWGQPSYLPYEYRGESTCNIEDVPVSDADKLRFHPNHTGTMVPSRFRE